MGGSVAIFRKAQPRSSEVAGSMTASRASERPSWMVDGMRVALLSGHQTLEVVGESHYQDSLWRLVKGRADLAERVRVEIVAVLVAEPNNPYDPNAVAIWIDGWKVGHLSRDNARLYQPGLLVLQQQHGSPVALSGVIVGGGMREDGLGRLGVFLDHDPHDFGVGRQPLRQVAELKAQEGADELRSSATAYPTYMDWAADLPADDIRAIPVLRRLLNERSDPLARHFIYNYLEARIYRSRNVFASALAEYDQICREHDAQVSEIRQACISQFGHIPNLVTYRQMAIRQQKLHNYAEALWWAERGLALYGDMARWPEHVDDLRHRAAAYRAKMG